MNNQVHEKFLSIFQSFLKDIITTLPEYSEIITEKYLDVFELETIKDIFSNKKLSKFSECIYKYNSNITNRNRKFFDDNPELIDGISIKELWNKELKPKNRNTIWKYLQSFCIIIMNLKSSDDLQKLLNGEQESLEGKKNLKDLKKLSQLSKNLTTDSKQNDIGQGVENILDSSSIGKIAKDIASNLDLSDINVDKNSDGSMDIGNIMQSTDFMGLFNKINEQVKEKFESGEINENTLSGEAENLLPQIMNNPFFKSMMNNDMFKQQLNPNN
jgi:hypothetical protein